MPARLVLERLVVQDLRNIARAEFEAGARVNVIWGNNGHGKTSLLEAIYFVATSKSFRTSRLGELVRHGSSVASVRGRFVEQHEGSSPLAREQTAAVRGSSAVVRIDGNRPASLAEFATRSPVVVFHPEEMTLSTGPALGRRTLLDRIALFMDPSATDHRARYAHAVKARQKLLQSGDANTDSAEIEAFEELCARHGAALTRARRAASEALRGELVPAFERIGAPGLVLGVSYAGGGSEDEGEAREELRKRRRQDAHRPSAGFGPHRDDLVLELDGHPARVVGSQGQHRALTLAMKAAETAAIAAARGIEPILLLDDVSSELDPERTAALFAFLALARGQLFLTTTRRELIATPGVESTERKDFRVDGGVVMEAS